MKLTVVILLTACLGASANGYSQKVTLLEKNARLEKVFALIEKQTGYFFYYQVELMQKARPVNIKVNNATLDDVLQELFNDQPFTYNIVENNIVIKEKNAAPVVDDKASFVPPIDIKGNVVNENREPLSGASIVIKRTGNGTTTNLKGEFELKNLTSEDILLISFTGYKPQSFPVKNRTGLQIIMQLATSELDKIVVQAYGTTTQRLTTGNIVKVTNVEIEKQPVMNPLLALQGRVAGLIVTPSSGYAAGSMKVEIRGRNSLGDVFLSEPLYIIDGVPLTILELNPSPLIRNDGSRGFDQFGIMPYGLNALFGLNPTDIESIEVLKDADATAIYGSRGANGVILITTKKGKGGKTKFNINISQGISEVTRYWDMLNTEQYLEMRREAFKNEGIIPTATGTGFAPDLMIWDQTRYTDWQKEIWGGKGKVTDVQAGLTGGDTRTTFRISANYHRQTEILTVSGGNQKGSLSFNLNHATLNQRFKVSLTTNYSHTLINSIAIPNAANLPPNAPPIFDKYGNLNYAGWSVPLNFVFFPFQTLLQPATSQTNFLTSNLTFNYQVVKGLSLITSIGYSNGNTTQTRFVPLASLNPANVSFQTGTATFGDIKNNNWIIEPQLSYSKVINKGKLDLLIGGSAQRTASDAFSSQGSGYTNDALLRSIANAPVQSSSQLSGQYKYAAVFGRITYNWENKYILNLNARRDGSSRFGPGKQFGNFGSAGIAWILTEEKWLKKFLPSFISFIKLRGSYGVTGSDAVGDYQYLSQWSSSTNSSTAYPVYGGISPLVSLHHTNADFQWEENRKLEGAFNLGLLDDRINLEVVYYRNRTNNQLTAIPVPAFTGFTSATGNWPAHVQNSGWEFVGNANIFDTKNFSWSVNFNTAINRNKLLDYPNIEQSAYYTTNKVGEPLNTIYLLHYTGVDPQTGLYSFADKNHDGTIVNFNSGTPPGEGNDDRFAYNPDPKFTGGIGSQFRYKNWNLGFFLNIKKQIGRNAFTVQVPGGMVNSSTYVFNNRWQKPGDITNVGRYTTRGLSSAFANFPSYSDGVYTDASFIRLQNFALSYDFPVGIIKKISMTGCRVFVNAQNVFVITKYKGIDPETQRFGILPPAKIFTGGISFNF